MPGFSTCVFRTLLLWNPRTCAQNERVGRLNLEGLGSEGFGVLVLLAAAFYQAKPSRGNTNLPASGRFGHKGVAINSVSNLDQMIAGSTITNRKKFSALTRVQ
ncbi:hypothetical protein B0H17DRAFT_1143358 [Mycena rosella]|uniref:Uncharacterized protein n=1 Tax=Mycena rosella TaxID=1033263 RepID=A0AAD7G429_MYCRO|nr:hypothetical protein B0H17DRAFT_1143358 [Mycena rosella]